MRFTRRDLTKAALAAAAGIPILRSVPGGRVWAQTDAEPTPPSGPLHGITMFGEPPKYPADMAHWDYVNPDAPKGGDLRLSALETFDSLNSYIVRGTVAEGVDSIYDSLLTHSGDESLIAYYAETAESFELSPDWQEAVFTIREGARFHDGEPIKASDVVFTHETLKTKGAPRFPARFYGDIEAIEAIDDRHVRIRSKPGIANRDIVLQIATFPIFPAHWWASRAFDEPSLEPPLGSGPYKIASVDPGRSISYERVKDYWGADLPTMRGMANFDTIRYDYYRDQTVVNEALKAGEFDFNEIVSSQEWTTGFKNIPAVDDGSLKLQTIESDEPEGFTGFIFNLRRPQFKDVRVREALAQFYDFETAQRTIHYGLYKRVNSYFPNSELAATGIPEGKELAILEKYRDRIEPRIFTEPWVPPTTDGTGNIRANLRKANELFKAAGWEVVDGVLTETATGQQMAFEILYVSENIEKVVNPFVANLKRGGINATGRLVDVAQYINRTDDFDFDMVRMGFNVFYPPGAVLRSVWKSDHADQRGDENITGIKDPIVDELVETMVAARRWDDVVASTRALDRYLLWQWVSIPNYYNDAYRLAYWDIFRQPDVKPRFGYGFSAWWFDGSNTKALYGNRRR
jgi:microcin C transport system substrate-binding protein